MNGLWTCQFMQSWGASSQRNFDFLIARSIHDNEGIERKLAKTFLVKRT